MPTVSINELSILLVEPSSTQSKIIVNHLQEEGVSRVDAVACVRDAWHYMRKYTPDLVISALYLPDAQAAELIQLMRNQPQLEHVPVMVVSSEQNRENLEEVRQCGALAILPKPFYHDDLRRALLASLEYMDPEELALDYYDVTALRVLVVDDSIMARKHIVRILKQMGMQFIEEAGDGAEAVTLIEQREFDLVVTDYNMPRMDGEALVSHIRKHSEQSHLPILMVTSEENEARLSTVKQAGVSAICDKPFEAAQMRALIHSLLDG